MSGVWRKWIWISLSALMLTGCGFHLRGEQPLAKALHSMYLQTSDPYGVLSHNLRQSLKMSSVVLTDKPEQAKTILVILRDDTSQEFLGVSGTQQIRQYNLIATVSFELTDNKGRMLIAPQTLSATRTITVQSNQILGSSNEANLYFKQMQRSLASSIMYRLSSIEITKAIDAAFKDTTIKDKSKSKTKTGKKHLNEVQS